MPRIVVERRWLSHRDKNCIVAPSAALDRQGNDMSE